VFWHLFFFDGCCSILQACSGKPRGFYLSDVKAALAVAFKRFSRSRAHADSTSQRVKIRDTGLFGSDKKIMFPDIR
jgi:hypothetical protein